MGQQLEEKNAARKKIDLNANFNENLGFFVLPSLYETINGLLLNADLGGRRYCVVLKGLLSAIR